MNLSYELVKTILLQTQRTSQTAGRSVSQNPAWESATRVSVPAGSRPTLLSHISDSGSDAVTVRHQQK